MKICWDHSSTSFSLNYHTNVFQKGINVWIQRMETTALNPFHFHNKISSWISICNGRLTATRTLQKLVIPWKLIKYFGRQPFVYIFRVIIPYNLIRGYKHFGQTYLNHVEAGTHSCVTFRNVGTKQTKQSQNSEGQNMNQHRPANLKYEGWNFNSGNTTVETPCNGTK